LGALAGRGPGYTESLAFLPDIVVIGSWGRHDWGMNKLPGEVWDLATFQKDYDDLVTRYMKLSSHPKIYVSLPVPILFGQGTVPDNGVTTSSVLPAIKAVAAKYNLPIIDLYTAFLGRKDLFRMPPTDGEGEHVADGPGLQHIADTVYAALMGNSDGGSQEASADSDSSTVSGSDAAVSADAAMPTSGSSSGAASNDDAGTPAGPGADASALQGGGNPQGGASGSSAGPPPSQGSSGCSVSTTHSDRKGAPLPFLAAAAMLVGIARRRRPAVRE
jgi:MYXO-CTERM domain-containing protein